ncbi:MAG: hypothetical protein ACHBNF_19500 [Chromatiales bacterium]
MEVQLYDPMLTALKIATRKSPLALHQANFVRGRLLELYPAIDKKRILIFRGADGRPLMERLCKRVGRTRSRLGAKALIEGWEQGQIDVAITTSSEGLRNPF